MADCPYNVLQPAMRKKGHLVGLNRWGGKTRNKKNKENTTTFLSEDVKTRTEKKKQKKNLNI